MTHPQGQRSEPNMAKVAMGWAALALVAVAPASARMGIQVVLSPTDAKSG